MATKYITEATSVKYAATSGMDAPVQAVSCVLSTSADEVAVLPIDAPITTATTIDLAVWDTITNIVVHNEDTTNYVEVEWYYSRGTRAAGNLAFADSGTDDTITDAAAGLVTAGGEAGGYVRVTSAEDAANDGVYLLQTCSTTVATLASSGSLTTNADDDTAVLSFERKNKVKVAAGATVQLGPVAPGGDVTLLANTAACACTVFIRGT